MSDPTELARLLNEGLSQADVWSEEGYYNREKLAAWLAARGVRVLPSEPSEALREALKYALALMEAEWEVVVLRGDRGISFTREERSAIHDRVLTATLAHAVDAAPRPEE